MFLGPSNTAGKVDDAFFYIVGISLALLGVVTICMLYFLIRYNRKRNPEPQDIIEPLWLEIVWTVVPIILVMSMFYVGWVNFEYIRKPPKDAMTIDAVGRKWSWLFTYASGRKSDVLRVPVNKPIKLILTSEDVIHSLYIPAFRIKEDTVPGLKTYLWFNASEPGTYDIFCTEYCGVGHSHMLSKVIVMQEADFRKWYATAEAAGAAAKGLQSLQSKGCLGCHSTDGSPKTGPTFKGLYGKQETVITNGQERVLTADKEFLENYIQHPNVDIIKGYPPIMPTIPMTDEEIDNIVEYIKTLK